MNALLAKTGNTLNPSPTQWEGGLRQISLIVFCKLFVPVLMVVVLASFGMLLGSLSESEIANFVRRMMQKVGRRKVGCILGLVLLLRFFHNSILVRRLIDTFIFLVPFLLLARLRACFFFLAPSSSWLTCFAYFQNKLTVHSYVRTYGNTLVRTDDGRY